MQQLFGREDNLYAYLSCLSYIFGVQIINWVT